MSKSREIELFEPIRGAGGAPVTRVTLRKPRYRDYMDLLPPVSWVSVGENAFYEQETPALLEPWIERLVDIDPNFLPQLELEDTLALRDAVIGFFRDARARADGAGADKSEGESQRGALFAIGRPLVFKFGFEFRAVEALDLDDALHWLHEAQRFHDEMTR